MQQAACLHRHLAHTMYLFLICCQCCPDCGSHAHTRHLLTLQVVAGLPQQSRVALLTFAAGVHAFDLSDAYPVTATALPGHSLMSAPLLDHLRSDAQLTCLRPLQTCRTALQSALQSLRSAQAVEVPHAYSTHMHVQ